MRMDAFQTYRCYLALRLHFTTDNYDIVKQQGRVRATQEAFSRRKDLYAIAKISKAYTDEEIVNFLVSNFVSGNKWGGVFDAEAKSTYIAWKKKIESLAYNFENEMTQFLEDQKMITFDENEVFALQKNTYPYIIKQYLSRNVSIETLVILNKLFNFVEHFDKNIDDTIVWPDLSRLIKKYSPFLKINKEKYNVILRRL